MSDLRIALLRSIVITPHRVTGADVRAMAEAVSGRDARSIIATGNVVFRSSKSPTELESELEAACAARFGKATEMVVKTPDQWRALVAANPFPQEARDAPSRLLAWAMRSPLPDEGLARLRSKAAGMERIERTPQGDFYCWFGEGLISQSKLPSAFGLRTLGAVGTNRNWNTLGKISAVLAEMETP